MLFDTNTVYGGEEKCTIIYVIQVCFLKKKKKEKNYYQGVIWLQDIRLIC